MIWITLKKDSSITLTKQLYNALTDHIIKGTLKGDERLDSSRQLAKRLGISRNIVLNVYDQLIAEGYLYGIEGSGTYVTDGLYIQQTKAKPSLPFENDTPSTPSSDLIYFNRHVPALDVFPLSQWIRCLRAAYQTLPPSYFQYSPVQGLPELRQAIARHLSRFKGIQATLEQIIILNGSMDAFEVISQLIPRSIQDIIVENPSYKAIYNYFERMDYKISAIEVTKEGIDLAALPPIDRQQLIIITPSYQFPYGSLVPIRKRISLLDYAISSNSFLVENDYSSDLSYIDLPIRTFFNLNPEKVFHVGTFSRSIFPSLRIGYMVIPTQFVDDFHKLVTVSPLGYDGIKQYALASFINEGHYAKHLFKLKKIYDKKRTFVIQQLTTVFKTNISIMGTAHDNYIICDFHGIHFDSKKIEHLKTNGVRLDLVSDYNHSDIGHHSKVILGFGHLTEEEIIEGIKRLQQSLS